MKCFDCGEYAAEFVLVEHEQVLPLCKGCLDGHINIEGDMNLKYWSIRCCVLAGSEPKFIFKEINTILKYNEEMYTRLLKEYNALKKRVDILDKKVNGG